MTRRSSSLAFAVFALSTAHLLAQGVRGTWREPGGSVINIGPCGSDLCLTLVAISPSAPARVDYNNPDAALRDRTLCGLRIGTGFHRKDDAHADGGMLYDPKSGKTYHGLMSANGDTLSLRGYLGAKAFGRTEKWTRTATVATCSK